MSHHSPVNTIEVTGSQGEEVIANALAILRPHIPESLPLYRRLQFGRFSKHSCLITNRELRTASTAHVEVRAPWLTAFIDCSCRPETECWLFGSWECAGASALETDMERQDVDQLVSNLVQAVKDLPVPPSIHRETPNGPAAEQLEVAKDSIGFSRNEYGRHAAHPNIMLWGAIHDRTVPILQRLGLLSTEHKVSLVPNHTFIWNVDELPTRQQLPDGLRWGEVQPEHSALVRSRTQIPRQDRTLAVLPSLAIYPQDSDSPICWAFVGLDSSLTSLHVEPEWRRKGLAKTLTTKLFREKTGRFWEEGMPKLVLGYVTDGNKASENMCRSLGGRSEWVSYWLRVNIP